MFIQLLIGFSHDFPFAIPHPRPRSASGSRIISVDAVPGFGDTGAWRVHQTLPYDAM